MPSLSTFGNNTATCSPAAIPHPTLFGAEILSLAATPVTNASQQIPAGWYPNHGAVTATNVSYCNVSIQYTHPGQNDNINVQVWLPTGTTPAWNSRLQAIGGGGWEAGLHYAELAAMLAAVAEGYATAGTDAGLGPGYTADDWALLSEGNPDLYALQNFASVSLNDLSVIAKAVTASFYGQPPLYSYWNGASNGGRQGLMLAQRYPGAFDGIAASAPAINWNQVLVQDLYGSFLLDQLQEYPPGCEFDAITAAAIEACDGLDGVVDGVISHPEACDFEAGSVVGKAFSCSTFGGVDWAISSAAATVVDGLWAGAKKSDNTTLWHGPNKDAVFTTATSIALLPTTCDPATKTCVLDAFYLVDDWVKYFIFKNSTAATRNLTHAQVDYIAHASVQQYDSIIGTNDPDLTAFRDLGGKMISYHGLADSIIPSHGSEQYYDAVTKIDPNVHDYFRLFLAPGIQHVFGGSGAFPDTTFGALRNWVENGTAPETVAATSVDVMPEIKRPLCPYPKIQYYDGTGNSTAGEGFYCE